MSVGQDLAQARHRAGLTVGQISQRTRIRETIIRGIERDDYSGCGGDFYARGHIRAIARAVGTDADPLIGEYDAVRTDHEPFTAAEAFAPTMPDPADQPRRPNWTAILVLALLVVAGIGAYLFFSGSGQAPGGTAAGRARPAVNRSHARGGRHRAASATAKRSASAGHGAAARARSLSPASVVAFGPGGVGHGDSQRLARLVIDHGYRTSWHSDWYTTARFGNLQSGTGLLLDMGRRVTVTGARIRLGHSRGAGVELRLGDAPALARLHPVAFAADASGLLRMRVARPVSARYVLVWFTRLPRDGSGTFQARIYNIRLNGRP
jgi:hypothetical protein